MFPRNMSPYPEKGMILLNNPEVVLPEEPGRQHTSPGTEKAPVENHVPSYPPPLHPQLSPLCHHHHKPHPIWTAMVRKTALLPLGDLPFPRSSPDVGPRVSDIFTAGSME